MSELPSPWDAYLRVQERLVNRSDLNRTTWGIEAALNQILLYPTHSPGDEDVERYASSERRKERHRAKLRLVYLAPTVSDQMGNPDGVIAARQRLRAITEVISNEDSALLRQIAEGYEYDEIAAASNTQPGALRVRVMRLRRRLRADEHAAHSRAA
jgi:hypothetical protein